MRYIDLNSLLVKKKSWGKRKELWKNKKLQEDFRKHSFNKCWYTEVILLGQDTPIDHWRPKAEVKPYKHYNYNKTIAAQGYDWLANEPTNYRLSCTYANRKTGNGGKGCYFPLADSSEYLTPNGNEIEIPLLLDPCNKNDVKLISYLGSEVVAITSNNFEKERVKVSSEIYNMNDSEIKAERRRVWDEVEKTIEEYDSNEISKKACLRRLKAAVNRDAQFSACAIACVNSLASDEIKQELDLNL